MRIASPAAGRSRSIGAALAVLVLLVPAAAVATRTPPPRRAPTPTRTARPLQTPRISPVLFAERVIDLSGDLSLTDVAAGDFNGDGLTDLALLATRGAAVKIVLGRGDGSFVASAVSTFPVGPFPAAISLADLDGNDRPDLAVAYQARPFFSVLLGAEGGQFTTAIDHPLSSSPLNAIATGDFDGDGLTDIAVAGRRGLWFVRAREGLTYDPPLALSTDIGFVSLVAADLDADRVADLLATDGTKNGLLGFRGGPDFVPCAVNAESSNLTALAVGDFNLDGLTDAVALDPVRSQLVLFRGRPEGCFDRLIRLGIAARLIDITVGRFDPDPWPDIVGVSRDAVHLYRGRGDFVFDSPLVWTLRRGNAPTAVLPLDVNGDARLDLVIPRLTSDPVLLVSSSCPGDCAGDGTVSVADLIRGVNVALGLLALQDCRSVDSDLNGVITVGELIQAVNRALDGCDG